MADGYDCNLERAHFWQKEADRTRNQLQFTRRQLCAAKATIEAQQALISRLQTGIQDIELAVAKRFERRLKRQACEIESLRAHQRRQR